MKTRLIIALLTLIFATGASPTPTATPINLVNVFGTPIPVLPTPQACQWQTTKNPIAANGIDATTISLLDASNNPMGPVAVSVDTNNGTKVFKNVQYPQTVVSTFAGSWHATVISPGFSCSFTLVAQ